MGFFMESQVLPISAQLVARVHFCELALHALVATHPDPEQLRAALDSEFVSALKPDVRPETVHLKDKFLFNLLTEHHHA